MKELQIGTYWMDSEGWNMRHIVDIIYIGSNITEIKSTYYSASGSVLEGYVSLADFLDQINDSFTISSAKGKMLSKLWNRGDDYGYWANN
jgi:hypothetical protein